MSLEEEAKFYIKRYMNSLEKTLSLEKSLRSEMEKCRRVLSAVEKQGLTEAKVESETPDGIKIFCGKCNHSLNEEDPLLEYYVIRYSVPIYEAEKKRHFWVAKIIECPRCKQLNILVRTDAFLSHLGWDTPEDEVFIK